MFVKRIKRFFGLFWQVLLLPGLFIPYYILLDSVIVDWLGCACPRADGTYSAFNANHFTVLFWCVTALVVMAISAFQARKIEGGWKKAAYLIGILLFSVLCARYFPAQMMFL